MSRPLSKVLSTSNPLKRTKVLRPRPYATLSPYTPPPTAVYEVFDEPTKARQRDRALIRLRSKEGGGDHGVVDYLREELAERLSERIEVCLYRKMRWLKTGLETTTWIYYGLV
jgi:hypothetical protein